MKRTLIPWLMSLASTVATASPITLSLIGIWETLSPIANVTVTATFDSAASDQDSWEQIGAYQLTSLNFNFTQLGKLASPFQLFGDVSRSMLYLYPTSIGIPTGTVRLMGMLDTAAPLPNGVLPDAFDVQMYFSGLADDGLSSLAIVGNLQYSSLYLSDQVGARSSNFFQSKVGIVSAEIPEPGTVLLLLASFGAMLLASRRDARPMAQVYRLLHLAAPIALLLVLSTSPTLAIAVPSTLAAAELEQAQDEAFAEGVKLARAASCMDRLGAEEIQTAFKAYRDANKALRVQHGTALNLSFSRGMKKFPSNELDFRTCMVTGLVEGRKAMLRGANAAAASLDKSMLPETMGGLGKTMMGVMVYAESAFVLAVASCVEDKSFREELSEDYVSIMNQFLSDRGNKVTPDWMSYPFERSDGPFKMPIGLSSRHPSCTRKLFKAGMAAELFRQINEAEDDTRGKWLVKRLGGN